MAGRRVLLCLALVLECSVQTTLAADEVPVTWTKIWTYYNYPKGASPLVTLNIRTWAKHNPEMEIMLVNDSNVKEWVPDMPDEFFKMPYDQAKSDVLRAATIYHHGGLYMDTDFLVMKPLGPILDQLKTHEIVSYGDHGRTEQTVCGSQFSSNWHGGRKHNRFSDVWWKNMKHRLKRVCEPGDFVDKVSKMCCHEKDAPEKEKKKCHVPWAQLEHLKQPASWKSRHTDDVPPPFMWPDDEDFKLYCLHGDNSLTPHLHGQVFWQPWSPIHKKTGTGHWELPEKKFDCEEDEASGDLNCKTSPRVIKNFFNRPAYHLFFSTFASKKIKTEQEMLHRPWLLSELFRRSLGLKAKAHKAEGDE